MRFTDHFDHFAPYYDRVIRPGNYAILAGMLELPVEGILLDAGGGTGRVAEALRGLARRIVVADLSPRMLRQAQAKDGLVTLCSQSERLPIEDGACERIIMVDALHHVIDQAETAAELWRVLKPGGRLVILEPDIHFLGVKLVALGEKVLRMRSKFLSPADICRMFPNRDARVHVEHQAYNAYVIVQKATPA
ncbi:MAG: class I SAM-dependent methyltransferase [Anaerolineales bacterium]|nr:class I SAM-dependent methyltransferase [Anaerolineales bacterium]